MINGIPVIGWLISAIVMISMAVPFWIVWTWCKIGETYAYFLPTVYQFPSFWDCVGLFIAMQILKPIFLPKLLWNGVNIEQNNKEKKDK